MSRLLPRKSFTLTIIVHDTSVLLGYKKTPIGQGKWHGFCGKIEEGETIIKAAKREVKQACSLDVLDLIKVGTLEFEFIGEPDIMDVHVFKSHHFEGVITESEDIEPRWFIIDDIPFDNMWPDGKYWLPLLLKGQMFHGYFLYDGQEKIVDKRLKVLDHLVEKK